MRERRSLERRRSGRGATGPDAVIAVAADLSTPEGADQVVEAALQAFGGIDILVNNVATAKGADIVNTPDREWQDAFDQTLVPAIRMSRLVVPHMRSAGRRCDHHDCVDLGSRIGRPDGLQRREGGRN